MPENKTGAKPNIASSPKPKTKNVKTSANNATKKSSKVININNLEGKKNPAKSNSKQKAKPSSNSQANGKKSTNNSKKLAITSPKKVTSTTRNKTNTKTANAQTSTRKTKALDMVKNTNKKSTTKKPASHLQPSKKKSKQSTTQTIPKTKATKNAKSINSVKVPKPKNTTKKTLDVALMPLPPKATKTADSKTNNQTRIPANNKRENKKHITSEGQKNNNSAKITPKSRSSSIIIGVIVSLFLIITSITLGGMIAIINFLPNVYLIPLLLILCVIAIIFSLIQSHPRIKSGIKIPFIVLSLLFGTVYSFGIVYLNQTFNFFDSLRGQEYISEQYYIIVKNDSSAQHIKDLNNGTITTFDEGIEIYQNALEELKSVTSAHLATAGSINELKQLLLAGDTDAIMLSAVHQGIVSEEDAGFDEVTRSIYTIEVKVAIEDANEHPNIDITAEPFTIYISGSDSYGTISDRGRSDVNMLATVNPQTHEILLVSIPRDYYVPLHQNGAFDKLTHAGIYGVKESVSTIADLLDINIEYYVKVNFSTLVSIVDTIGGIDVYSDQQFVPHTNRNLAIPQGNVHMDGAMALAFARERYSYSTGDRHRVQNQQDVLMAILKKISGSTVILTKYSEILNDISNCLETNVGKDEISNLIKLQLQDMPNWQIGTYSLNGSDAYDTTYSMGAQELYVMRPNLETVEAAHSYIDAIIEGKTITELNLPKSTN